MKIFAIMLTLTLVLTSVTFSGEAPNGKPFIELQNQVDELKNQIQILREQMDTVQNDVLIISEFADIIDIPTLIINDVEVSEEGQDNYGYVKIPVAINKPTIWPVQVDYQTVDGTAKSGDDYIGVSGTAYISPGQTVAYITIHLQSDSIANPERHFTVEFSNPLNVNMEVNYLIVNIINDDPYWVVAGAGEDFEGSTAECNVCVYYVDPDSVYSGYLQYYKTNNHEGITVTFGDPLPFSSATAEEGNDFIIENRTVYIPPGEACGYLNVELIDDGLAEGPERAYLPLVDAQGALYKSDDFLIIDIWED